MKSGVFKPEMNRETIKRQLINHPEQAHRLTTALTALGYSDPTQALTNLELPSLELFLHKTEETIILLNALARYGQDNALFFLNAIDSYKLNFILMKENLDKFLEALKEYVSLNFHVREGLPPIFSLDIEKTKELFSDIQFNFEAMKSSTALGEQTPFSAFFRLDADRRFHLRTNCRNRFLLIESFNHSPGTSNRLNEVEISLYIKHTESTLKIMMALSRSGEEFPHLVLKKLGTEAVRIMLEEPDTYIAQINEGVDLGLVFWDKPLQELQAFVTTPDDRELNQSRAAYLDYILQPQQNNGFIFSSATSDSIRVMPDNNEISPALQRYLATFVAEATTHEEAFERLGIEPDETCRCALTHSVPNRAVRLDGVLYDYEPLLTMTKLNRDGSRENPITRDSFTLREIAADRETNEKIVALIQKKEALLPHAKMG